MASGKVLGGQHIDAPVDINRKGELSIQLRTVGQFVLKERKLSADEVAAWEEVPPETRTGTFGLLGTAGQAAAGAVLPGFVGRAAAAAVGAGMNAAARAHLVRVEWTDGDQSLIRLPEKLFAHLQLTLEDLQVHSDTAPPTGPEAQAGGSATDRVLAQVVGLIGDRRAATNPSAAPAGDTVAAQLMQLTTLHDQGALTDTEFAAAKARLLE